MIERTDFSSAAFCRGIITRARRICAAPRLWAPSLAIVIVLVTFPAPAACQAGGHILFGDIKVDETQVDGVAPLSFDVILYSESGTLLGRQTITNNGRYRFLNVSNGRYEVVVEVEGAEVARLRVWVQYAYKTDHRQDLHFELRRSAERRPLRPQTVSAADFYTRTPPNDSLFEQAQRAMDDRKYAQAASLFRQILAQDAEDFQAWTELGTAHLFRGSEGEAESAYREAIRIRSNFSLALLNLGRLLIAQKRYVDAVEPLIKAVQIRRDSADANYLLAEAYLQTKRGSKALLHLNEAIRLDPKGKAEAHLRLATLYRAAGMKSKAADEYIQFLAKRPAYSARKQLEKYIAENQKPQR